jgi:ribosomal protein L10
MANIIITETQLKRLKNNLKENKDGSYMAKQQLFTIATLAYKMWEQMEDGEQIEDWMESKIAQAEQGVVAVVKAFMYDEVEDELRGMEKLDYNDLVIGM